MKTAFDWRKKMLIKDLLEKLYGDDVWIEIRDERSCQINVWRKGPVIEKSGYCNAICWTVKDNNIIINTRS